ncbi:MAG: nitrate reductase [Sphingomonadales bacterium]|nr:nitrate reductase [Sphingomonadales bacterium]MBD3772625.1 nitrate reductase [Paracoccaceae bacterium]MBD3814422.1 nitrate reductase [Betaproteobacteria bacterium]
MTLLEFARGPAINAALVIFVFGVIWRLFWLLFLPRAADHSVAKLGAGAAVSSAAGGFVRHMWPPREYAARTRFSLIVGYVLHFGLAIIVFGFAQHILFIRDIFGIGWPGLPTGVITVVSVITLAALIAALVRRMTNPVLKMISTFADYWAWFVVTLPVVTGLMAVSHLLLRYEDMLGVHILSVALMLATFPFSKLMHAFLVFVTRSQTSFFYSRRGSHV